MERKNEIEKCLRYAEVTEPFVARMMREKHDIECVAPMTAPNFRAPLGTPERHPADVVFTKMTGYVGWEVKHDGTSNRTNNIFIERNALEEVRNFCERVVYFAYTDGRPAIHVFEIKKLLAFAKKEGHFVPNAGDTAKGMRGRENSGWLLPVHQAATIGRRMSEWEDEWTMEMMRHPDVTFAQPPEPSREELRALLKQKYKTFLEEKNK